MRTRFNKRIRTSNTRTRNEESHLAIGSMTVPALVTTLGLIILRWAVRGTKVEPMGARMLAWVERFLWGKLDGIASLVTEPPH